MKTCTTSKRTSSTTWTRTRSRRAATRALASACALAALAAGAAEPARAAGDPEEPRAIIEATVDQVLGILRDEAMSDAAKRERLEEIANRRFDFRVMARLVMGRNWRRLDEAQREEFVSEFKTYLANDYGERLQRYDQEKVEVLGEQPRPRGDVVVGTKIVGGENDGALVDYRMRRIEKSDADWRIIDVVIEGISLVANFRDQFREVVSSGGPEDLLRKLREKNAEKSGAASAG